MPFPSELVREIQIAVDNVLQDAGLNPQQQTFVTYIQKISTELSHTVQDIPPNESALRRIIPSLGDSFLQQQAALFGYAKLLLEHPQSFDDKLLSEYQQDQMRLIYQYGQNLYELTEEIQKAALDERRQQHNTIAVRTDLRVFFNQEESTLHYFLRNHAVKLSIIPSPSIVTIVPYHLAAFIQHIVITISHELIESGQIKINNQQNIVDIFGTGLVLDTSQQDILFKKDGRYAYPQRFIQAGGSIHFLRDSEYGATIRLVLPQ